MIREQDYFWARSPDDLDWCGVCHDLHEHLVSADVIGIHVAIVGPTGCSMKRRVDWRAK